MCQFFLPVLSARGARCQAAGLEEPSLPAPCLLGLCLFGFIPCFASLLTNPFRACSLPSPVLLVLCIISFNPHNNPSDVSIIAVSVFTDVDDGA